MNLLIDSEAVTIWKCYENDLFFCYIQKVKCYYFNSHFINFEQISHFQIIFWSGKLEENYEI